MSQQFGEGLQVALPDRYRVAKEVGCGGMATVYLADDTQFGRRVAIKVLHPDLATSLGADRFAREIRVLAQLNHPQLLGSSRQRPYDQLRRGAAGTVARDHTGFGR